MKILVFIPTYLGNTETFIYTQIQNLSRQYEVKVLCMKKENEDLFPFSNVSVLQYPDGWLRRRLHKLLYKLNIKLTRYSASFSRQVWHELEEFQPDIIHCHFGIQALYLIDNLERSSLPIVITFHGYDASLVLQTSKIYRKRLKNLFKRKNVHAVFVCNALRNNLHNFGICTPRSRVIYLGIETDFFHRTEYLTDGSISFLQVSSLVEKKGHYTTLLAFCKFLQLFPEKNAQLIFLGNGPMLPDIRRLINQLGISGNVKILGHLSPEMVLKYLSRATVFLHHSVTSRRGDQEGIPTSIKEAMSMGLPVVSTKHSGIPELVFDNIHGFLVEEFDLDSYVEKMQKASEMGLLKINRERIVSEFEAKKQDAKLASYFLQIISSST